MTGRYDAATRLFRPGALRSKRSTAATGTKILPQRCRGVPRRFWSINSRTRARLTPKRAIASLSVQYETPTRTSTENGGMGLISGRIWLIRASYPAQHGGGKSGLATRCEGYPAPVSERLF